MTENDARDYLLAMYDRLLRQTPDSTTLDHFIAEDFVAHSDGVTMNRQEFEGHLNLLREKLSKFEVQMEKIVSSPDCIAALFAVDFFTAEGTHSKIQVNAFYFMRNEQICRLDELTQLISGREEDRGLVARSS
ncbi:MAG: hypothetical protein AAGF14_08775 [Pseudomonadota bacterium]